MNTIKIISAGCLLLVLGLILSMPGALKYGNIYTVSIELVELERRIDCLERNMNHAKRLLQARETVK